MSSTQSQLLEREAIANRPKHWVRLVTACNSRCLFCLDSDTPRNVYLPIDEVKAEILRGRTELSAWKVILSGGEAALHPQYVELIAYAKEVGYGRIQTVTNGWRYADKEFFDKCMEAGLQELTFSLHGHTQELHETMTAHPGSFERIVKGIVRAKRHPSRPIVSIDVCINKQNVADLDKIVELGISLGVTEYDLLHIIPQAAAFDNRDELFYDPKDHIDVLHKVFKLNQHPRFVIWTNRFPVEFLEGLEDLIQDPHKMLDEVNGRRFQVRNYLDTGAPLSCRQPERCVHCFIEPFCTSMDRAIERQHNETFDVWWMGDDPAPSPLPFGAKWLGVSGLSEVPTGQAVYLRSDEVVNLGEVPAGSIVVMHTLEQLADWEASGGADGSERLIELNAVTGPWMLSNRSFLSERLGQVRVHQPSHELVKNAIEQDIRRPGLFFKKLDLPIRVSGLPACLCPGTTLIEPLHILEPSLFEDGRFKIKDLARFHIREGYQAKSIRCRDCVVKDRCDGAHVNYLRDQGLGTLEPLTTGDWAVEAQRQLTGLHAQPLPRLANGRPPLVPAPSLAGHVKPDAAPEDPLSVLARTVDDKRAKRRAEIRAKIAAERKA
jgi:pyruvate-formate lyase-activating enzyme